MVQNSISSLSKEEHETLSRYLQNHFSAHTETADEDLSFLDFWRNFIAALEKDGAERAINTMLIPQRPVALAEPAAITARIHMAEAGEIPVISVGNAEDFENIIVNLVHKGKRPEKIGATGASFIYGKTTRFIILSAKPYSNVSAATLGLDEADWQQKSMEIRLAHECTHFFTKRFFGASQNHLHDELMADFFGMMAAFGYYKAEYFEYFMGIKGTEGSRLSYYIPDCSERLFAALKEIASAASHWLEDWSHGKDYAAMSHAERIRFLCGTNLALMAGIEG